MEKKSFIFGLAECSSEASASLNYETCSPPEPLGRWPKGKARGQRQRRFSCVGVHASMSKYVRKHSFENNWQFDLSIVNNCLHLPNETYAEPFRMKRRSGWVFFDIKKRRLLDA